MSDAVREEEKEAAREAAVEKEAEEVCCANCGIAQVDDIKLEECDGCQSVSYCSDNCQENHREQHEEECKKRKAELRDKELFEQPDGTHLGECPICFLPMPFGTNKSTFCSCCCKLVCTGCCYADYKSSGGGRCAFCREPVAYSEEENIKRVMKRVKVNDPAAMNFMGATRFNEGDYDKAIEYFTKAAELGDIDSQYRLGCIYYEGEVVEKDEEKAAYHSEKAAIGGHPTARYNLGSHEGRNGNIGRAVKHYIVAANLGDEGSMEMLWNHYLCGLTITKEDLDATLRSHQSAIDATKSLEREEADAIHQQMAASRR